MELAAVETETEDDFMYFRDSVHMALEDGKFASRFPILMKTFLSDWEKEDAAGLERELKEIQAAFASCRRCRRTAIGAPSSYSRDAN